MTHKTIFSFFIVISFFLITTNAYSFDSHFNDLQKTEPKNTHIISIHFPAGPGGGWGFYLDFCPAYYYSITDEHNLGIGINMFTALVQLKSLNKLHGQNGIIPEISLANNISHRIIYTNGMFFGFSVSLPLLWDLGMVNLYLTPHTEVGVQFGETFYYGFKTAASGGFELTFEGIDIGLKSMIGIDFASGYSNPLTYLLVDLYSEFKIK